MPDVSPSTVDAASAKRWPEDGFEIVPACPICEGGAKELMHRGLRDRIFRCAPGEWDLYRCSACGTGYLNPRPNAAKIGLAYSRYYTHAQVGWVNQPPPSAWRRHRIAQRNAYLNAQYGYQLTPASMGTPRWLSTARRQRFDKYTGFLRYPGKGARLLDVGCGNGCFLLQMRGLGWEVAGVEPDPDSAAAAVAAGLDVRVGLLDAHSLPEEHFDAVSLHHVLEHLHHPLETLRRCRRVLKPGGVIYIATPNLASEGHRLFGPDWFNLDPPRHLVLFTPESLRRALEFCGFKPEPALRLRLGAEETFIRSRYLQRGSDPVTRKPALPLPAKVKTAWLAWQADRATRAKPELTEELVLLARRP